MTSEPLRSCPHCRAPHGELSEYGVSPFVAIVWWCVTCTACGYTAESAQTPERACANWDVNSAMAMSDAECLAEGIAGYGSEEAYHAAMGKLRDKLSARAEAILAAQVPTPDPAVLVDYIDKLTRFYMANPQWVALCEEARGYIGRLAEQSA